MPELVRDAAGDSPPPVAAEVRPRTARRRPWDAAKWILLTLAIASSSAAAALSVAAKADAATVQSLTARMTAVETDAGWLKSTVYAIAQRLNVIVPPPPRTQGVAP